jgi:hypothetical protein
MKEIINGVLHVIGGLLIALSIMWNYWLAVPVLFVVGFLREQAQHRDEGLLGWITGHRLFEAFLWPVGALIACIIWLFIKS